MKQLHSTDFVVYNERVKYPLCFRNGDIIIYHDEEEAEEDCLQFESAISVNRFTSTSTRKIIKPNQQNKMMKTQKNNMKLIKLTTNIGKEKDLYLNINIGHI
jgi:hypothetical protein